MVSDKSPKRQTTGMHVMIIANKVKITDGLLRGSTHPKDKAMMETAMLIVDLAAVVTLRLWLWALYRLLDLLSVP